MPPRKELKESVVYPASKRKPPPFKPLRPSKVQKPAAAPSRKQPEQLSRQSSVKSTKQPSRKSSFSESEDENEEIEANGKASSSRATKKLNINNDSEDDSSQAEELPNLPELSKFSTASGKPIPSKPIQPRAAKPKRPRDPSPMSILSKDSSPGRRMPGESSSSSPIAESATRPAATDKDSADSIPPIPQPLLIRLLHERFQDKSTKIDKHAIQVVQKYVEIFVCEAIARTALLKREEAERGEVGELDGRWLELGDLEKVAPGMMMDF